MLYLFIDPPRNGNLVFTAHYTDEQGAVSVSEPIYVTAGNPPTLDWLTPADAKTVFTERPVTLSVQPDDTDGTVTNVSYYLKQGIIKIPIGQGAGPNFGYSWTPPAAGDFVLVAVATDNDGLISSNFTHRIHVEPAITRISFVSPSDGSSAYCQRPVPITLALSDPLKRFDHAEVFANNVSLGQMTNATLTWVPAQTGNCLLTARIYEKDGTSRTADNAVNVLVIPAPQPVVTLTTPVDGSQVPVNEETVVVVNLYDPAALITDVRFYVNGTLVGQNATRFAWTPTQLGSNALQCVARTTEGNSISSETVNVTVAEMHPPTVSLLSPTNGQWFVAGSVPLLSAQASDPDGSLTLLTLTLDRTVLAEGAGTTLEAPASATPGWHEAAAEAIDNDGLETASEVIRFFIERSENPVLPVPAQLSAIALSASEIQLSWLPLATNELMQCIIVERWDDEHSLWTEITELQAADSETLDMGLAPETNYRYRMACVDTNGCRSAYSEEANATTRTVVPTYAVLDLGASLSGLLANRLPGGNILTNTGLTHFDSRRTGPLGTRHAEAVLGASAAVLRRAVARFTETWPQIRLDLDPVLLSPHSILPSSGYLTGPGGSGITVSEATAQRFDPADPGAPVKAFVQEHQDLFGFGAEEFDAAVVQRDYVSPLTAARTQVWQQQVAGIPVFGALFIGHVTSTNELAAVSCDFIPAPGQAANPAVLSAVQAGSEFPVTAQQALLTAVANVGDVCELTDITVQSAAVGVTRGQSFAARKGLKGEAYVSLTWFPVSRNELVLARQVIFTSQWRGEMFLTVVSVLDNQLLYRRNLTVTGSPAAYRVYTGSSPAPLSPGLPVPGTGQPTPAARSLVTLDALDAMASPAGWINDGDNETRGNNVDAHLDRNDDDAPDLPRPTGSPARTFDFALEPAADPSSYGAAAAVQLFYWNNWMHDVLYGLGFTEAGGNFQNDNFGRGGLEGDAVQADAQDGLTLNDGKHRDNANISVPPDGYAPRMQMYVFDGSTPARDGSLDAEIILHEYTHGLTIRTVGGGAGIDALQTAGMAEGWSDFYALALLADPAADVDATYPFGAYVAYHGFGSSFEQNNYYGIRRYPYSTDLSKNPLTFADIDPTQAGVHADVPGNPLIGSGSASEIHRQGEVWGVMLWEVRANLLRKHGTELGNSLALALVTEGLRLSPPNPNYVQARDAILLADRMLSEGADAPEIWAAFSKRGLGYGAKAPYAYSATGVRESGELPPALLTEQVEVQGGNGNGVIEANEVNNLLLMLRNQGAGPATQVSVQLSTATPGVQLLQSQAVYGDIPPNHACLNAIPFQIATLPEFVEGTPVELSVTMTSAQGVSSGSLSFYTGGSGPALPSGDTGLNEATSLSAEMKDLTPKDLGALEPLWMAEDASCLLKAAKGKYVLWRPYGAPVLMENPNFTAHRVKRHGFVVGELACPRLTDRFGNVLDNTVGAVWTPGDPEPTPLRSWSAVRSDDVLGLAYNRVGDEWIYRGGVDVYPRLHTVWDMNASWQFAGSDSVYMRPFIDRDEDSVVDDFEVRYAPTEWNEFEAGGKMSWLQLNERSLSADYPVSPAQGVYYNAFLVSASTFAPGGSGSWLGPLQKIEAYSDSSLPQPFHVASVLSQALLINDRGDVAGIGGGEHYGESRVFRWNPSNGLFALDDFDDQNALLYGLPVVQQMGLLPGGQRGFPYAMNKDGDIAGYSNFDSQEPHQLHAVLWRAGQTAPQALGALSKEPGAEHGYSVAYALNDSRQVVGTSRKYISGNSGALMNAGALWQWNAAKTGTPGWEISDLDRRVTDPDWRVLNAVGISANGWMLGHAQRAVRDGQGNYTGSELRAVLLMPGDLDIDSDNDDGPYGFPDRSAGEDRIEDRDDQPGKIVMANSDDSDGDNIPDFADGFNWNPSIPNSDGSSYDQFVPLMLELPLPLDLNVARLEFVDSASDPAAVTCQGAPPVWKPAEGALRIWTLNGQFLRNKNSVAASTPGHYVAPHVSIPASALGFSQTTKTLYVEGIQRNATNGVERILVRLDPDGPGPLGCVDLDAVRVTVCDIALIPDYDRDGIINDADRRHAATNETYRFWINDDADVSANEGSNVPGAANPDYADGIVNGLRDLNDWFPVMIDISRAVDTLDLSQFTYWLCHEGGAVNVLIDPDGQPYAFENNKCNSHVFDPDIAGQFAAVRTLQVGSGGVRLKADFMQSLMRGRSTVLLEGRKMTRGTRKNLALEIRTKNTGKLVCRSKLFVSLDSVTGMYRQLNLRSVCGGAGGMRTRTGEPPNLPDVSETDIKHIVYVHGYNINGVDALGEQSAVFKNLWWCGSTARFHGVSWYGDATQVNIPTKGLFTLNFYTNTASAFLTAPYISTYIQGLAEEGEVTVIAHSLGNMAASAAISLYTAPAANYFMLDAAVAQEAYRKDLFKTHSMVNANWSGLTADGYPNVLFASEWHTLFPVTDARRKLTMRGLFTNMVNTSVCNFYSSGEDVVGNAPYGYADDWSDSSINGLDAINYAWCAQEKLKGRIPGKADLIPAPSWWDFWSGDLMQAPWSAVGEVEKYANAWLTAFINEAYPYKDGGWMINKANLGRYYSMPMDWLGIACYRKKTLEEMLDPVLTGEATWTLRPLFTMPSELTTLNNSTASSYAEANRFFLLSHVFPASTYAMGGNPIDRKNGIDSWNMNDLRKSMSHGWWEDEELKWTHSDFKNVSLLYTQEVYKEMIMRGKLK
jgi:hypothetical protein